MTSINLVKYCAIDVTRNQSWKKSRFVKVAPLEREFSETAATTEEMECIR